MPIQLILISGLSGSGKSIALNVLEDCGYYCIDNLPFKLLPDTLNHLKNSGHDHIAISIDARGGESLQTLPAQVMLFRTQGIDTRLIFLEAKTDTLVARFSETRRCHPLSKKQRSLPEAIRLERDMLEPVIAYAHHIDTSDLGPNNLRAWIKDFTNIDQSRLTLQFQSFGFKHSIPLDADMVFDARCLPNPHYDPQLRPLTGRDTEIIHFLEQDEKVCQLLNDIRTFVEKWLPCFIRDNRSYLTVAIGCTGGRHRSVYLVEALAHHFRDDIQVLVRHRELS